MGLYFVNLLKNTRRIWHQNCTCLCIFCRVCQHGKYPTGDRESVSCHDGSCTRCATDECPLEWNGDETEIWIDRQFQQNEKKKRIVKEIEIESSREYMSERIAKELQDFEAHVAHCYHWKRQYRNLIRNLLPGHVVIRWDFIGKYFHPFL